MPISALGVSGRGSSPRHHNLSVNSSIMFRIWVSFFSIMFRKWVCIFYHVQNLSFYFGFPFPIPHLVLVLSVQGGANFNGRPCLILRFLILSRSRHFTVSPFCDRCMLWRFNLTFHRLNDLSCVWLWILENMWLSIPRFVPPANVFGTPSENPRNKCVNHNPPFM